MEESAVTVTWTPPVQGAAYMASSMISCVVVSPQLGFVEHHMACVPGDHDADACYVLGVPLDTCDESVRH